MKDVLRCILVALVVLGFASPSVAAVGTTRWMCWLHNGTQAACAVLTGEAASGDQPVALRAGQMNPGQLMHAVRSRPGSLAGQLVFVPLYNVPFDDASVEQLVSAVLCGASQGCVTHYHSDLARLIAKAPEMFADMHDPLLAPEH